MKKLLLVLAVGAFVACNNGGGEEPGGDTPVSPTPDTPVIVPADTPVIKVDTPVVKVDTPAIKK